MTLQRLTATLDLFMAAKGRFFRWFLFLHILNERLSCWKMFMVWFSQDFSKGVRLEELNVLLKQTVMVWPCSSLWLQLIVYFMMYFFCPHYPTLSYFSKYHGVKSLMSCCCWLVYYPLFHFDRQKIAVHWSSIFNDEPDKLIYLHSETKSAQLHF